MTVASIQVANGIRGTSNEGRHSTGTLNRCESRAGGPAHGATRAQAPISWAFGVQVSCEASSAAGSFGSMTHLDCCAGRNVEIRVFRLDVLVVPSRDLALHDLCQDTRRKLQALGISNLTGWHGVKHSDGSQAEGHVHHGSPSSSEARIATWVHWDIASSKVGQPSSEVTGRLLRKFPLTRAAAHCAIGQSHVLQQPRLHRLHDLPEVL
mmetsp:Transcript_64311/g.130673  ORF Transcript_64311/g.130673 Transcript_64311/m.130673 type:complete len:209 (+) Transcript_64311:2232-2858(+)